MYVSGEILSFQKREEELRKFCLHPLLPWDVTPFCYHRACVGPPDVFAEGDEAPRRRCNKHHQDRSLRQFGDAHVPGPGARQVRCPGRVLRCEGVWRAATGV